MLNLKSLRVVIALSIAMPFGVADTALAAKKPTHVTYEQAYARCEVHVDTLPRDAQSRRYTCAAACMPMYGYRL
jgi:hypothetical protein